MSNNASTKILRRDEQQRRHDEEIRQLEDERRAGEDFELRRLAEQRLEEQ